MPDASPAEDRSMLASAISSLLRHVRALAALGAAVCLAYSRAAPADQARAASEAPARVATPAGGAAQDDPKDDPLPPRGAVRLGTARYRYGTRIESLAVSADGRLAAASAGQSLFSPAR